MMVSLLVGVNVGASFIVDAVLKSSFELNPNTDAIPKRLVSTTRDRMRSVPPRGSGWVGVADCQLPNADWVPGQKANWQSEIDNWQ
jgi:hypothetical protein